MPNRDYIQTIAHELIAKFDTRDPFELCKAIGVEVFYADLGNLKGMYKYLKKNRFAVIDYFASRDPVRSAAPYQ